MMSVGVGNLFACWFTDLAGAPGKQVVTIAGYYGGYRSCSAFRIAEAHPVDNAFCAASDYMNRHPIGSKLVLVGKTSALGIHIAPISKTNP
jgi:hypothetical protein